MEVIGTRTHSLDQFLVNTVPSLVDFEEPRKAGQAVGEGIAAGMQCQIAQTSQAAFHDKELSEGRIANDALQLEDGHFARGIFLAAQALDQLSDIDVFHGD